MGFKMFANAQTIHKLDFSNNSIKVLNNIGLRKNLSKVMDDSASYGFYPHMFVLSTNFIQYSNQFFS